MSTTKENTLIAGRITYGDLLAGVQRGYRTAAEFTDTGEEGQPEAGNEWSDESAQKADIEVETFADQNIVAITSALRWHTENSDILHAGQVAGYVGHDLWMTRNGHGVGFWDRPEIYGEAMAAKLTEACLAIGGRGLYLGDDGKTHYGEA